MSRIKELSYDFTRGLILGAGVTVGIGGVVIGSMAFAAPPLTGGLFGAAINAILETGRTWQSPGDGMVKNAAALSGGLTSNQLLKIRDTSGCPAGSAINKIDEDGNVTCVSVQAK